MLEAVKVALDPTPRQERLLESHAGAARFAYNNGLAHVKDVLAVLRVVDDPTKHVIELEPAGEVATGGSHPRHHLHVPGAVLVCNQLSDQVTVLPFDEATGQLGDAAAVVPGAQPSRVR